MSCQVCHSLFDPFAYAFEPYDSVGRYQKKDEFDNEMLEDGTLSEDVIGDKVAGNFKNAEEMQAILAKLPDTNRCFAQRGLQFALGRVLDPVDDACLIESVALRTEELGGSFDALVTAIATHPNFSRVAEADRK
jgi:hypothetical protein